MGMTTAKIIYFLAYIVIIAFAALLAMKGNPLFMPMAGICLVYGLLLDVSFDKIPDLKI